MATKKQMESALYFLDGIAGHFPDAAIELDHQPKDPFTLLVAVILSAQTTDKMVNQVTPGLFAAFPDVHAMARATPADVETHIRRIGLYRNKAKNVVACAQMLLEFHGGVVPSDRKSLEALPGVGKKTAAVVVANAFGQDAIAVDTHVARVAQRTGMTREKNPDKIEVALTALLPEGRLLDAHHTFIWHGRRICHARNPQCEVCPVVQRCPRKGVDVKKTPKKASPKPGGRKGGKKAPAKKQKKKAAKPKARREKAR
jgi:endonuclease-3